MAYKKLPGIRAFYKDKSTSDESPLNQGIFHGLTWKKTKQQSSSPDNDLPNALQLYGESDFTNKKTYKHRFKKGKTKTITKKYHRDAAYPGGGTVNTKTTKVFQDGEQIKKKRKIKSRKYKL